MKATARVGHVEAPVRIHHWWPGREWAAGCPIPEPFFEQAEERGSKYLTFVTAQLGQRIFYGSAFCCPKDFPSRKLGRKIALTRLASVLESYSGKLVVA